MVALFGEQEQILSKLSWYSFRRLSRFESPILLIPDSPRS